MGTEIKGGSNQLGILNRQFNGPTVITNSNNNFTLNINVNCTECGQHQHHEGVSDSLGNIHHAIDFLQKIAATCGNTTHKTSESTTQNDAEDDIISQPKSAIQAKSKSVDKRGIKVPGPDEQTQASSTEETSVIKDSVRILDSKHRELQPGDAVWLNYDVLSIYVGDGYIVSYLKDSRTTVKEKLDLTRPFKKSKPSNRRNLSVYSPEQRVLRALEKVDRPCPVPDGDDLDFVTWNFTGLSCEQSTQSGFDLLY